MIHLLNDVAHSVNEARFETQEVAPLRHREDREPSSLRATVGNALIRAGTRLLPPVGAPSQAQPTPPC
jgi:hypothetical protein